MKPDFSEHRCTFLLYPSRIDVWRKNALPARQAVSKLCDLISSFEQVYLGTDVKIGERLSPSVTVVDAEYNDIWVRDSGPVPNLREATVFNFNAWGGEDGLYGDWSKDSTVANRVCDILNLPTRKSFVTLEGGNLTTDGEGTLISVKAALINPNRNPNHTSGQIEEELKDKLDIKKIIWLDEGLIYDETGGHVDNVCAFVGEGKVFLAWTDDKSHPQYNRVREIYSRLSGETDAVGRSLNIIKIPLPSIFYRSEDDCDGLEIVQSSKERYNGEPIQASYINFIFVNSGVIVPQFGDENDAKVLKIFKNHFKNLKVVPFNAREIVLGGGGLHCITKNM